jgi:hypothetical protein
LIKKRPSHNKNLSPRYSTKFDSERDNPAAKVAELRGSSRESSGTFTATDWTKSGVGLLYALKTYQQDDVLGQETTSLGLRHTPQ